MWANVLCRVLSALMVVAVFIDAVVMIDFSLTEIVSVFMHVSTGIGVPWYSGGAQRTTRG